MKRKNIFLGNLSASLSKILRVSQKHSDPLRIKQEPAQQKFKRNFVKKLGLYTNEHGDRLYSPAVSRFSKTYYPTFGLTSEPFPNSFPFFLMLSKDEVESLNIKSRETYTLATEPGVVNLGSGNNFLRHLIDYENESDYQVVFSLLSDLDKKILRIIAEFRNVQHIQLVKELRQYHGQRIERSLSRLHRLYLIEKHSFTRDPLVDNTAVPGQRAFSYSIYSHGTMLLLKHKEIDPQYAYKWKEQSKREDEYSPVRHWKIVDTYLNLSLHQDFSGFIPYSYLKGFSYTEQAPQSAPLSDLAKSYLNENGAPSVAQHRKRVPWIRFEGQIIMKNQDTGQRTKFDLYPLITEEDIRSDLSKLGDIFKHFGRFNGGVDDDGYKRYLVIIVDGIEQIETIEQRYSLSDGYKGLNSILFLDLETSSEDYLSSLKIMQQSTPEDRTLKTIKFNVNKKLLAGE